MGWRSMSMGSTRASAIAAPLWREHAGVHERLDDHRYQAQRQLLHVARHRRGTEPDDHRQSHCSRRAAGPRDAAAQHGAGSLLYRQRDAQQSGGQPDHPSAQHRPGQQADRGRRDLGPRWHQDQFRRILPDVAQRQPRTSSSISAGVCRPSAFAPTSMASRSTRPTRRRWSIAAALYHPQQRSAEHSRRPKAICSRPSAIWSRNLAAFSSA